MNKLHFISNYNKMLKAELENIKSILIKGNLAGCVALWGKIEHMVENLGQPTSVEPMVKAILKGVKWIKFPAETYINNSTDEARKERPDDLFKRSAKGHFRWNRQVYTLSEQELKIVKKLVDNW